MKNIFKNRLSHNTQVQFLRGFFCISLVLYHYTCRYSQLYTDDTYYVQLLNILGNAALGGFLLLSGFYFNNPCKNISPRSFIVSKIKRLYPEYIIAIVIIYLVSLTGLLGHDRQLSFIDFLANIPMVNVFMGINYVDGSHWYVTFLLGMALFFSVLILVKLDKKMYTWLISSCIWMIIVLLLIWKFPSVFVKTKDYIRYYILFSTGVAFRIYHVNKNKSNLITFSVIATISCISIVLLKDFSYLLCIVIASIIIGMAINNKLTILSNLLPIVAIGDISYLVYLLHQNIGYCIINFLKRELNLPAIFNVIIAFLIIIVASFGITYIKGIGDRYVKKISKIH